MASIRQAGGNSPSPHNIRRKRKQGEAPPNEGSRRLLAAAEKGERLDKCLWAGMAKLTSAQGNSTALVGTPDQVADALADALADYHDLGVDHFLLRGFDPLVDTTQYGRELIPATRKIISERAARRNAAA